MGFSYGSEGREQIRERAIHLAVGHLVLWARESGILPEEYRKVVYARVGEQFGLSEEQIAALTKEMEAIFLKFFHDAILPCKREGQE